MQRPSQEIIERTKKLWQTLASRTLTDEDAREIIENITGFFQVLAEWHSDDQDSPPPLSEREATDSFDKRRWPE